MEWSSMDYLRVFFSQARASRGTSIVWKRAGRCSEIWIAMPWTVSFWNILKLLASMAIECCEAPIFSWSRLRLETTVRKPSFSLDGGWTDNGLGCEMEGWPKWTNGWDICGDGDEPDCAKGLNSCKGCRSVRRTPRRGRMVVAPISRHGRNRSLIESSVLLNFSQIHALLNINFVVEFSRSHIIEKTLTTNPSHKCSRI